MFKNRPFFLAAVIFGSVSLILAGIAAVSFLMGDSTISSSVARLLHLSSESFSNSTIAQISVILSIPCLIFGYRSIADNE